MSCENNPGKTTAATSAAGIPNGKNSYYAGRNNPAVKPYLTSGRAAETPWPPARLLPLTWRDYRATITATLKAWRSRRDDRKLLRMRAEMALTLANDQAGTPDKGHPAGIAGSLAEERARMLISPPASMTVGEQVEQVAVLDNALALLRLKGQISEQQYRAALIDTVNRRQALSKRSKLPVAWLPQRPVGMEEESLSAVDPGQKVRVRYRAVELSEPVASNARSGAINADYNPALQPRQRERAAGRRQIQQIAAGLNPVALLRPGADWSSGPPLVGQDGMAESGNGRLLALRTAAEEHPDGYETYRELFLARAHEFGLGADEVKKLRQPVLVRERLTELDDAARRRFVTEANAAGPARMGAAEQAAADAKQIPPGLFAGLHIAASDRSLSDALGKQANAPTVARFAELLPRTERAALSDSRGQLSAEGANRIERAMFAYALPGKAGERLARLVFEEGEAIDRVGAGLKRALPKLGRIEDMFRAGQRDRQLSIGGDIAAAVGKMRDIGRQGLSVNDYLRQHKLLPELTSTQEQLLAQLDARRRSGRAVAELLNAYADKVVDTTAPPNQAGMLGDKNRPTREGILRQAIKEVGGEWVDLGTWSAGQQAAAGLGVPAAQAQRLGPAGQSRGMQTAAKRTVKEAKKKKPRGIAWAQKWPVPAGSGKGKDYTVARDARGRWGCSCPKWIYQRRPKDAGKGWQRKACKHIEQVQASGDF